MNSLLVGGLLPLLLAGGAADAAKPVSPAAHDSARAERDDAVRAVVEGYYRATDKKDLAWIDAHTVPDDDAVIIGTDASEYWYGWKSARPAHEEMLKALGKTTITVSKLRIKQLADGRVAVANYLLDIEGTAEGKPFSMKSVRATMVLERRGGKWLMASGHASLGANAPAEK